MRPDKGNGVDFFTEAQQEALRLTAGRNRDLDERIRWISSVTIGGIQGLLRKS